jgi:histidyl-tRNA synthetase
MNIKYKVDHTLVRGLDYYTNFVFEINSTDARLSGQPTLIGGGRYNNLVKEIGGPECGCVGFATGIERLLLALEYEKKELQPLKTIDVVIANLSSTTLMTSIVLLALLRSSGLSAICKFDTFKLPKHFSYAESQKAKYVIILGEKELKDQKLIIKNQKSLKQEIVAIDQMVAHIKDGR